MVGKSAGPSSSTECSPMRFALAASSSSGMSLKHHRQTDCLIGLAAPRAGITALSSAERCGAPPDAHAPTPASAPPTSALFCTNSRRLGMTLSWLRRGGRRYASSTLPQLVGWHRQRRARWHQNGGLKRMTRIERMHGQLHFGGPLGRGSRRAPPKAFARASPNPRHAIRPSVLDACLELSFLDALRSGQNEKRAHGRFMERRDSASIRRPNTTITTPHHRLTFVTGATSDAGLGSPRPARSRRASGRAA